MGVCVVCKRLHVLYIQYSVSKGELGREMEEIIVREEAVVITNLTSIEKETKGERKGLRKIEKEKRLELRGRQ